MDRGVRDVRLSWHEWVGRLIFRRDRARFEFMKRLASGDARNQLQCSPCSAFYCESFLPTGHQRSKHWVPETTVLFGCRHFCSETHKSIGAGTHPFEAHTCAEHLAVTAQNLENGEGMQARRAQKGSDPTGVRMVHLLFRAHPPNSTECTPTHHVLDGHASDLQTPWECQTV